MGLSEADTRAKLIDPALHARGWTEDLIRREETAGAIEIVAGLPRKQAKGRVDYTLPPDELRRRYEHHMGFDNVIEPNVQVNWTVSGTTPSLTCNVDLWFTSPDA